MKYLGQISDPEDLVNKKYVDDTMASVLPTVTSSDNGKVLTVIGGEWALEGSSSGTHFLATISGNGNTYCCAIYDGVTYYTSNSTFEFESGDTLTLEAYAVSQQGTGSIIINGTTVATSYGSSGNPIASYSYTLPSSNIKISLSIGAASTSTSVTILN